MLSLIVAEDTCDRQLASGALAAIERRESWLGARLVSHIFYHKVFGDLQIAEQAATGCSHPRPSANSETSLSRQSFHAAEETFFRVGTMDCAASCYSRACQTAAAIGLQSGRDCVSSGLPWHISIEMQRRSGIGLKNGFR